MKLKYINDQEKKMYHALLDYDALIKEDNRYFDMTAHLLGIGDDCAKKASITFYTREDCTVCGTEEVRQIFRRSGIETVMSHSSGEAVGAGTDLISGTGNGYDVISVWKLCQNILEHTSGIASKAARFVRKVHDVDPDITVLTTRKVFPGTKALALKAIMAGGAFPHRIGLSETVLIFDQHVKLAGGIEAFFEKLDGLKKACCEKKIIFETADIDLAMKLLSRGVDGIQTDKLSADEVYDFAEKIRREYPNALIIAAGGINENNAAEYARAAVNGIVTTSIYTAKPVDIGTRILPADGPESFIGDHSGEK